MADAPDTRAIPPDFKSERHARIIDVEGHQVLFWIEPDGDNTVFHKQIATEGLHLDFAVTALDPMQVAGKRWLDDVVNEDVARALVCQAAAVVASLKAEDDAA